jgi:hypothetical protein
VVDKEGAFVFNNNICDQCPIKDNCEIECTAIMALIRLCKQEDKQEKAELIKSLSKELSIIDYEVAEDLKELGEKIINAMSDELHVIKDFDVNIGYVRSYERKLSKGNIVNADCRKVNGTYTAYLPFDFIITFYEPNMDYMTENQKKILMLHELRHIGIGEKGLRIEPHSVEDFKDILHRFGIDWNDYDQDVPDILGGENNGKEKGAKKTKGNSMASKRKASSTGGHSAKSRG